MIEKSAFERLLEYSRPGVARQVLYMRGKGMSQVDIASELNVNQSTVSRIMSKIKELPETDYLSLLSEIVRIKRNESLDMYATDGSGGE